MPGLSDILTTIQNGVVAVNNLTVQAKKSFTDIFNNLTTNNTNIAILQKGMPGHLFGLTLSTAGGSSTFGITAGNATDTTFVNIMNLSSAFTKTTAAWAVGSGNGSLDTGVIANSTWYHVFIITRTDTNVVDILISLSATAPTMPTNYTLFRRIGSMLTDGSAHWTLFSQLGNEFLWSVSPLDQNNVALNAGARNAFTLSVPLGVKVNALFLITVTGTSNNVLVTSLDQSDQAPSNTGPGITVRTTAAADVGSEQLNLRTDVNRQLAIRSSVAGNFFVSTYGWIDNRGILY